MDQEPVNHAHGIVSAPTEEGAAEGTSCDCPAPEPGPWGVCGCCLRLRWQSVPPITRAPAGRPHGAASEGAGG